MDVEYGTLWYEDGLLCLVTNQIGSHMQSVPIEAYLGAADIKQDDKMAVITDDSKVIICKREDAKQIANDATILDLARRIWAGDKTLVGMYIRVISVIGVDLLAGEITQVRPTHPADIVVGHKDSLFYGRLFFPDIQVILAENKTEADEIWRGRKG